MEIIGYNFYDFVVSGFNPGDVYNKIDFGNPQLRANSELKITFADGSESYFTPKYFKFHSPSEHSVDGELYDVEVQIVHTIKGSGIDSTGAAMSADEELYGAAISIFFDMGAGGSTENAFIESVKEAIYDGTKI